MNGSDTGTGTGTGTNPTTKSNGDNTLDIQVLNNGVKLVGEALVPGASLLLEKHIGAGVLMGTLGVLGGAALGRAFGPIGYILARYGASAVSFQQSLQEPAPADGNKQALKDANQALLETNRIFREAATVVRDAMRNATPPPPPVAPAFSPAAVTTAAATIDVRDALDRINDRLDSVERSMRTMRQTAPRTSRSKRATA